jgi:hypothetical protein
MCAASYGLLLKNAEPAQRMHGLWAKRLVLARSASAVYASHEQHATPRRAVIRKE